MIKKLYKFAKTKTRKKGTVRREPFKYEGQDTVELREYVNNKLVEVATELRNRNLIKVNELFKELTIDKSYVAFCFYEILTNKGFRSPGLSKFKPKNNEECEVIINQALHWCKNYMKYRATPLVRVYIPKPNGDKRPLSVPSYVDRVMQRIYAFFYEVIYEEIAHPNSFGFRRYRSHLWSARNKRDAILTRHNFRAPKYALEIDLEKYFDSINHDWILNNLVNVNYFGDLLNVIPYNILYQWLKSGYIEKGDTKKIIRPTTSGVPQGGIISPVISNLVLHGIENFVYEAVSNSIPAGNDIQPYRPDASTTRWNYYYNGQLAFTTDYNETNVSILKRIKSFRFDADIMATTPGILKREKKSLYGWSAEEVNTNYRDTYIKAKRNLINEYWIHLSRFVDDLNVLTNSESVNDTVLKAITDFGAPRGFSINKTKTKIKLIADEGFELLSFKFSVVRRTQRDHIYYYPSRETVLEALKKVSRILNTYKKVEIAFLKANEFLRGWLYAYCYSNSKNIFTYMSHKLWFIVFRYLWNLYSRHKRFRVKSLRGHRKELASYIYSHHLTKSGWWFVRKVDRLQLRYKDKKCLHIANPAKVRVVIPIIAIYRDASKEFGLSGFHPDDVKKLRSISLKWKPGIYSKLLHSSGGRCACCDCDLLQNLASSAFEIHHISPPSAPDFFKYSNLCALCKLCHRHITNATIRHDTAKINYYIKIGLLSPEWLNTRGDPKNFVDPFA